MARGGGSITMDRALEIIEELVLKLQTNFQRRYNINVAEVVKGGSLGQGTALPGDFDADIILYSRDISPRDVVRSGVSDVLKKLDQFLASEYGRQYARQGATPFALQFMLYDRLEIDLLPSPHWDSADEYHSFLTQLDVRDRRKLQSSEAKWEKYFFQTLPDEVKEYIKRAKAWRNTKWPKGKTGTGRPKSFLLGLLVADAYRKSVQKDPLSVTRKLRHNVKNHATLRIHWDQHGAQYRQHYIDKYHLLQAPCIIDPANPFNNVYKNGLHAYQGREDAYGEGDGNWTKLVEYIDTLDLRQGY